MLIDSMKSLAKIFFSTLLGSLTEYVFRTAFRGVIWSILKEKQEDD